MIPSIRKSRRERVSELFPTVAHDEEYGLFLNDDHTLGAVFETDPIPGGGERLHRRVHTLLRNEWPEDSVIQVMLFTSPDVQPFIQRMERLRRGSGHSVINRTTEGRKEFILRGTEKPIESFYQTRSRDLRVYFTLKIPISGQIPTEKEREYAYDYARQLKTLMATVGFAPRWLNQHQFLRVMKTILNWGPGAPWRNSLPTTADPNELIRNQYFDYDNQFAPDRWGKGVWLGEEGAGRFIKSMSPRTLPASAYFGQASMYLGDLLKGAHGIRHPCLITCNLYLPRQQKIRHIMSTKRQYVTMQAHGPLLKFSPKLAAKKKGFDTLFASAETSRLLRMDLGITLFGQSRDDAAQAMNNASAYWNELGIELVEDKYFQSNLFLNRLPLGAEAAMVMDSFRYRTMTAEQASVFLPIMGDWKGTGNPAVSMFSRNGQVMGVDLWDSDASFNAVVAAESGSGKSFFTNKVIQTYLAQGAQVWVIDVGRSYAKLTDQFDGDFMAFKPQDNPCLNPFPMIHDYKEEEDTLVAIVKAMVTQRNPLDDFQNSALKEILAKEWEKHGQGLTTDLLQEAFHAHPDHRVQDLGQRIYSFTSKGQYGAYFTGTPSINFQNALTVLELEELKGKQHLQTVVLLILIQQIQQAIFLSRQDRKSLVIIDEAWDLLNAENVRDFLESGYRRFRKYGASGMVIVQSLLDLYKSDVGRVIVDNSPNKFILAQDPDAIKALKNRQEFAQNDLEYEMLEQVETKKGYFSEMFIRSNRGSGVARLIVDPFQQLLYSTDPDDKKDLARYTDQGMSVDQAIERVLRDRGRWDQALQEKYAKTA